jgi:hypothetical protein
MNTPDLPELDELARTRREALEAALEEMVNSGFGDLEAQIPAATPAPAPALAPAPAPTVPPAVAGWW